MNSYQHFPLSITLSDHPPVHSVGVEIERTAQPESMCVFPPTKGSPEGPDPGKQWLESITPCLPSCSSQPVSKAGVLSQDTAMLSTLLSVLNYYYLAIFVGEGCIQRCKGKLQLGLVQDSCNPYAIPYQDLPRCPHSSSCSGNPIINLFHCSHIYGM